MIKRKKKLDLKGMKTKFDIKKSNQITRDEIEKQSQLRKG